MSAGAPVPGPARGLTPPLFAALGLGALHALSFAPWPSAWLQILSLGLMLWLWRRHHAAAGPARRIVLGLAFGLGWFGTGLCWLYVSMHDHGGMPAPMAVLAVLLFAGYLSIYPVAALWWAGVAPPARPVAGALRFGAAWTVAEWLRGLVFTGFPWLATGYAHVDGVLSGFAPVLGVFGISGLSAFLAACVASLLQDGLRGGLRGGPAARCAGAAALVLAAGGALSLRDWSSPWGPPIQVRLLQGNVPQSMKFDPQTALRSMAMYAQLARGGEAQLTVMPETAWTVPWDATPPEIADLLTASAAASASATPAAASPAAASAAETTTASSAARPTPGGVIAIGMPLPAATRSGAAPLTVATDAFPPLSNSVLLLEPGRPVTTDATASRYDKRHLVPFGEFVPPLFAWFVRMMRIPLGDFGRGSPDQPALAVAGQRLAFNICYEDLFGEELIAALAGDAGATILVNVSNIAWFGRSHALPQHLAISRMRAMETARPMLRSTNTGMTASIDARGQVRRQLEPFTVGALEDSVQGMRGLTPYARLGNAGALLLALLAVAATLRPTRTR